MKQVLRKWGTPLLSAILVAIFPAIFLYGNNSNEANIQDVFSPMLLFVVIALVLFFICFMIIHNTYKSAIITVLFMLVFENFATLEALILKINPNLRYWHTTAILLFILLHIAYLIYRFLPEDLGSIVSPVLCLVLGALVVVNIVVAIPGEINKMNAKRLEAEKSQTEEPVLEQATDTNILPNIYLLIFDEYCGFNQIKKYYNYDNNVLKDFLEDNDFTISYDSHNESIMSSTIATNLVNLDYIVDNTWSESEKEVLRHNGKLFSLLSDYGYDIRKLTTMGFYGQDYPLGGENSDFSASTAGGETLNDLIYMKTLLYPFMQHEVKINLEEINFLLNPENIPNNSTFSIMHINLPHTPFYFDEYGNENAIADWLNWNDNKFYLGQYKYATSLMIDVLDVLRQNDPQSLIIVMSDHGARASTDPALFMEKFELNDMNNILNTFYYCGEDLSPYTGKSAVNTLRVLLNHVLGTDFSELEVPADEYKYK